MAKQKPVSKLCKYCKTEIPYTAKVCPQCRKKLKGGKLKWILLVLVALIVVSFAFGGNSNQTGEVKKIGNVSQTQPDKGTSDPASNAPTAAEKEPVQTQYRVGDILMDGDMRIVYMSSGEYTPDNPYSQPAEGKKVIFIQLAFENTSPKNDQYISSFSFEAYADGYNANMFYGGGDDLSATLSAGRTTTGFLYYEVPKDAQKIEIEYETNVFTEEKITFLYEGEQDCGYVPAANTNATEGAIAVGTVMEHNKLKISYLSCEDFVSSNMLVQPKDGFHFVTCAFEFENLGDSDAYITAGDFDCYADGATCDQIFIRDDALSATISAGRKATGTVTFEVPDSAAVIEAEFLANFWTSNRVVFTIK